MCLRQVAVRVLKIEHILEQSAKFCFAFIIIIKSNHKYCSPVLYEYIVACHLGTLELLAICLLSKRCFLIMYCICALIIRRSLQKLIEKI